MIWIVAKGVNGRAGICEMLQGWRSARKRRLREFPFLINAFNASVGKGETCVQMADNTLN